MEPRRATHASIAAVLTLLVAIAALGNQWYVEHVVIDGPDSPLGRTLASIPSAFNWRASPLGDNTALWAGQIGSIVVLLALVGGITAVLARRTGGGALFVGVWGGVVLAAVVASIVRTLIAYGDLFGDRGDPQDFGRFFFAVLQGPTSVIVLWAVGAGAVAALIATLVRGGDVVPPPEAPLDYIAPPPPAWTQPVVDAPAPLPLGPTVVTPTSTTLPPPVPDHPYGDRTL